jgi:hypothetical protein
LDYNLASFYDGGFVGKRVNHEEGEEHEEKGEGRQMSTEQHGDSGVVENPNMRNNNGIS